MPPIRLPTLWTIVADFLAWGIIQPGVAYLCLQIPEPWLRRSGALFAPRRWEAGGALYERLFRVRAWKDRLPSGGPVFQGFSMRTLASRDPQYVSRWLVETYRAELTHWLAILPAALFFLWNPLPVGWMMVVYACAVNLPCVIVQRYNRPRLLRILGRRMGQIEELVQGRRSAL